MLLVLILAAAGVAISLTVHLSTFFGYSPLVTQTTWASNMGLCAVWLPIWALGASRLFRYGDSDDAWKIIPPHAPEWAKRMAVGLLLYAFFNFTYTMVFLNQGGYPIAVDDGLVLRTYNFGVVLKQLTPPEFYWHQAWTLRAGSGHWIFLYYFAAMTAYSKYREGVLLRQAMIGERAQERVADQAA